MIDDDLKGQISLMTGGGGHRRGRGVAWAWPVDRAGLTKQYAAMVEEDTHIVSRFARIPASGVRGYRLR